MYVQGAEAWAADILRQDLVDSPESDHLGEQWAIELPPLPVDGGAIVGRLEDLQGRFNLNNLVGANGMENELARRQFERLLLSVDVDPALAGAVVDWLDPDTELRFPTRRRGRRLQRLGSAVPHGELDDHVGVGAHGHRGLRSRQLPNRCALRHGVADGNEAQRQYRVRRGAGIAVRRHRHRDGGRRSSSSEPTPSSSTSTRRSRGSSSRTCCEEIDGVSEHFLLTATVTLGSNQLTMRSVLQRDRSGITRAVFRSLGVE